MFYIAMITYDRAPSRNYLAPTLQNLKRGGVFTSHLLERFSIIDGGSESLQFIWDAVADVKTDKFAFFSSKTTATKNAARAFGMGGYHASDWVLFLEDDIDVCANFLESTDAWLTQYGGLGHVVYPLGANYTAVGEATKLGQKFWLYPVNGFYGTLAVAVRPLTALSIGAHLLAVPQPAEYDLRIGEWAQEYQISHFLTPAPSFVQHIGAQSSIRPGKEFHQYESWPGRNWSFR